MLASASPCALPDPDDGVIVTEICVMTAQSHGKWCALADDHAARALSIFSGHIWSGDRPSGRRHFKRYNAHFCTVGQYMFAMYLSGA